MSEVTIERNDEPRPFVKKAGKPKRKPCNFCREDVVYIDYKDARIKKYLQENGKITPRRQSGTCATHQRELTVAIKRARNMSLV